MLGIVSPSLFGKENIYQNDLYIFISFLFFCVLIAYIMQQKLELLLQK
ncbi:hypothetical protein BLGI_980 [Brevibacillus laterosporus GI-9]|nr:hypothetical protein BLGI_980 [Brevibacillus laterosporus GI-9]